MAVWKKDLFVVNLMKTDFIRLIFYLRKFVDKSLISLTVQIQIKYITCGNDTICGKLVEIEVNEYTFFYSLFKLNEKDKPNV